MNLRYVISLLLALVLFDVASVDAVDFADDVQPILRKHCFACHGPEKQKSGFRLDLRDAAMKGGAEGVAIVPGRSAASSLVTHITAPRGDDLRMPPKGDGLSDREIDLC